MGLNLIAYLLIPATTFLLAGDTPWLSTNFSVLGTMGWGRLFFPLWGLLIGSYFYIALGVLLNAIGGSRLIALGRRGAVMLFFCALFIPYLPDVLPVLSLVHVLFALCATLLLFFTLLGLLLHAHKYAPQQAQPYLIAMVVIAVVTFSLLAFAGFITTALEIFLVLSNVILFRLLLAEQWET